MEWIAAIVSVGGAVISAIFFERAYRLWRRIEELRAEAELHSISAHGCRAACEQIETRIKATEQRIKQLSIDLHDPLTGPYS